MQKRKLIIANWKMNPTTAREAQSLFSSVKRVALKLKNTHVVICPPFLYESLFAGKGFSKLSLGAQDTFWIQHGAYTGEISPLMLSDYGVKYVIAGHSERRRRGEDSSVVNKKVQAILNEGMTPIICVGETERDAGGLFLGKLEEQVEETLRGISRQKISRIILAYEPVWAIGKTAGDAMKPHELHETILFIRKVLSKLYGRKIALALPIIYGGSAEPDNVAELLQNENVSGFLVGHVSLNVQSFNQLLRTVDAL